MRYPHGTRLCEYADKNLLQVYESSKFATELGAAIHIPPNVYGLLERMGIDIPGTGANLCQKACAITPEGQG
jgi:hypothetical protein